MKSPNFWTEGEEKTHIVLHVTLGSAKSAISWLTQERSQASYHYLIKKSGNIVQLVDDENYAWHAGRTNAPEIHFEGNPNKYTYGVAFVGEKPTQKQIEAFVSLYKDKLSHIPIPNIITHQQIATDKPDLDWVRDEIKKRLLRKTIADLIKRLLRKLRNLL